MPGLIRDGIRSEHMMMSLKYDSRLAGLVARCEVDRLFLHPFRRVYISEPLPFCLVRMTLARLNQMDRNILPTISS